MKKKRMLAWLLSVAMLVGTLPGTAFAATEGPPCENHRLHTAECGYVEGHPCEHTEHTADCYTGELVCELDGDAAEPATGSDAAHEHTQDCYALDCPHERGEHDDTCGYAEAQPCKHSCDLCAVADSGPVPGTSGQNVQNLLDVPSPTAAGSYDFSNGTLTIHTSAGTTEWRNDPDIAIADVTALVLESGVESIGDQAFFNCKGLTSVDIPDSVKSIGNDAFSYCEGLETVSGMDGVESIGHSAFSDCKRLTTVTIPGKVTSIGATPFVGCESLTAIDVAAGNPTYRSEDGVLYGDGGKTLHAFPSGKSGDFSIPDGVESIGSSAFAYCAGLTGVTIPDSVTSIGNNAFSSCTGLTDVVIPDSVNDMGNAVFSTCTNLTSVSLSGSVKTIWPSTFAGCASLTVVTIPASVTFIYGGAFNDCASLSCVIMEPTDAPTVNESVAPMFGGAPADLKVYIPDGASDYDRYDWTTALAGRSTTPYSPATGVTLDHSALTLEPGTPGQLTATVEPGNGAAPAIPLVSWSSDAPSVAEVDQDGKVTAKALGEATVTATSLRGDYSADCVVTVANAPAAVTTRAIPGVTAPAKGAPPATTITDTTQYSGTVAWNPAPGAAFAADTDYTATITLTPKAGYTFTGVSENFFTVAGATRVSNAENSGIVTAVFPKTSTAPVYSIRADTAALNFGAITVGDTPPAEQTVTVTNTGNQSVTLTPPTATNYDVGALSKATLAPGEPATFTVRPQAGLAAGSHNETLTISGSNNTSATVSLTFTVNTRESGGSGGGGGGGGSSYSSRTLTDKPTGIVVKGNQIHENAALTVGAGSLHQTGDAGCDLLRAAQTAGRVLGAWDVSLSRAFLGSVTVSLPVEGRDGQTLTVAHCIGGKLTLSNVKVQNGMAAVTADSLSPFAVLDGVYTLETLAAPVAGNPFTDVKETDWFYKAVLYAYQRSLMNGTAATTFDPQGAVTRAQPPVVLYRLEGSPAVTAQNPFTDVRPGLWYADGITWAAGAGLVDGYSANTYGPGDPVTREQLAVMLWRYAKYKGWDVSMGEDTNILSYADAADISEWAVPAFQWACGAGIIDGTTDNRLAPKAGATRAELAQMLMRLLEKYKEPAAPVAQAPGTSKARRYKVQKGDTLSGLAGKYKTTVAAIVKANPIIQNPNFILPGWELDIP